MKIVDPSFAFMAVPEPQAALRHLEAAARTCYKSEEKIAPGSAEALLRRIVHMGHESVLEHVSMTVRIICDRGVSHELVRHRLCSFSQESTRYANYAGERFGREITVIRPFFWSEDERRYQLWLQAMEACERAYLALIDAGASAQEARSVLPQSLKTEVVMTANVRQWRHIFALRCAKAAHPQMRQIMLPLLVACTERIPVVFDDLASEFREAATALGATAAVCR
ncbi:MAG: thymidylate synthase, flavin-dependent [Desulfomicrobiaceae bacterium]|jgi:thymidylate synthase (FAD)|nr:thymidylate synthase, flavin-dependent [Desulfomicrobiaceae bacterium]MBZ4685571.1 thymidylate synthase, flavin-dependent [Desulfomicrobiaceae bacterium]MDI3493019.1 thymidylate synthase [Desulfomicrobiaceae bacterium]MDK2872851.1 thymidylate synthase [Desulfomicrobiaceae bacterium]HCF05646.1 FAD-dependent thymidylate synthase [Desulfomicrobiaceae bacterium]